MSAISVIIPVYNAAKTIANTVDSVLAQTMDDFEVLVMDDGSTDGSAALLAGYGDRVRLFRQANGGVAVARNRLLAHATGNFIAFLDADDLWHPHYLKTQMTILKNRPEAIGCFTGRRRVTGTGRFECAWPAPDVDAAGLTVEQPERFLRRYSRLTGLFTPSFFMVRTAALKALGEPVFPPEFNSVEDYYLIWRLALEGSFAHTGAILGAYRIVDGSLSSFWMTQAEKTCEAMDLLQLRYRSCKKAGMRRLFRRQHASNRRTFAKFLLGTGRMQEARGLLRRSLDPGAGIRSIAESIGLIAASLLPRTVQPPWPPPVRESSIAWEGNQE